MLGPQLLEAFVVLPDGAVGRGDAVPAQLALVQLLLQAAGGGGSSPDAGGHGGDVLAALGHGTPEGPGEAPSDVDEG